MVTRLTLRPRVSVNDHGVPIVGRIPGVEINQGMTADVEIVCRDSTGNPFDLSTIDGELVATAKIAEAVAKAKSTTTLDATITDAATGVVTFTLTSDHTTAAAVYQIEVGITSPAGLIYSYRLYLHVVQGLATSNPNVGPPTPAELRIHLRDSMPDENLLIDELEFDPAEHAAAICRPVEYFNETLPPIGVQYDTESFPFRQAWIRATIACLLNFAAAHYRRNRAQYQTQGGAMIDDKNREAQYLSESTRLWEEYKAWVREVKTNQNNENAYSTFGSTYDAWTW